MHQFYRNHKAVRIQEKKPNGKYNDDNDDVKRRAIDATEQLQHKHTHTTSEILNGHKKTNNIRILAVVFFCVANIYLKRP